MTESPCCCRYLLIECEDQESPSNQDSAVREMYLTVLRRFSRMLQRGGSGGGGGGGERRRALPNRQQTFIDKLVLFVKSVARESGNKKKKVGEKKKNK